MNIFYLDSNPVKSAELHCDKHVVKMIIEYAQLMSTAHRVLDGDLYEDRTANNHRIKRWRLSDSNMENVVYKASHINHPSAIWTRASDSNYQFVYDMFVALCNEYTHRYGRVHLTEEKLKDLLQHLPNNIASADFVEPPQAMPDDVKTTNAVDAYQNYYRVYKKDFAKWTDRQIPSFMKNITGNDNVSKYIYSEELHA
jgi:hypothetical protein